MPNKELGIADPVYDALRIRSGQSIAPDLGGGSTGGSGLENKIYVWHADGSSIDTFDPTAAGLAAALAAAVSGDTVWLPSMTIALTTGVTLKAGVMLDGIDTSAQVYLSVSSSSDYAAIIGPGSGEAYIGRISVRCTNSGSGAAVALLGGAGNIFAHGTYLTGSSTGGAGYGVQSANGIITLRETWVLGSTAPIAGTGTGDSYTAGAEISAGAIPVTAETGTDIFGLTVGNWYAVECFGGPWNADPLNPHDAYDYQCSNDGGVTWSGHLGNDGDTMYLTAPTWGVNPIDLDGNHAQFFFQATAASIKIRVEDTPGTYGDNTGALSWRLRSATHGTSGIANIITHAVRMSSVAGEPAQGDRSVWDALAWQARHANDIDDTSGVHHTLTALDLRYGVAPIDTRAYPVGWLEGWRYRTPYTVANADGTYTNKKVPLDVNTLPLVEADKCNDDLSDLRVTSSDGVSLLPFYRANEALLFNKANFARYASNPILTVGAGGSWEGHWVQPSSIVNNGGTLYMYYTGNNLPATPGRVGLATSTDGFAWTKDAGNPIVTPGAGGAWDDFVVGDLFVIKEGANWYGWYAGAQIGLTYQIGYVTSSDGITWTKSGSNPVMTGTAATWDSAGVLAPSVLKIGSTYYMWYTGWSNAGDQSTLKIGLATSTDRVTWTKHASNPLLQGVVSAWDDGVLDCDVQLIGGTYFMFYQGNTADQNHSAIGLATSPDGIVWTRSADNPWPKGTTGTWDEDWNEGPVLYRLGSEWLMYYMGSGVPGATGPLQIGVMQFPDTRLWPIIPSLTSSGTTLFVYYGNASATDVSTGSAGSPDVNITVTAGTETNPDLAAWDDETQPGAHARDISDASYTLHLNPALNANVGTFGDENNVAQITVDARGLITAAANVAIALGAIDVYNEIQIGTGGTIYYLANEAEPDTVRAYVNGIRQPAENGASASDVVTFSIAPDTGDTLIFDYELAVT